MRSSSSSSVLVVGLSIAILSISFILAKKDSLPPSISPKTMYSLLLNNKAKELE